jgi:hypothetical protein
VIKIFGNFKMGLSERYAIQAVRLYVNFNNPPQESLLTSISTMYIDVGEYIKGGAYYS